MTHRDAEGPRCAGALGHLDTPHRWGVGLARAEPSPESLTACLHVGCKLLERLSIDAAGALAVELPPRLPQDRGRQERRQRGKTGFGILFRLGCYLS
jgi:hypothetical protein